MVKNRRFHVFTFLAVLFLVGFIFSSWTLAFINLPAAYTYRVVYEVEGNLPQNLTLIIPVP